MHTKANGLCAALLVLLLCTALAGDLVAANVAGTSGETGPERHVISKPDVLVGLSWEEYQEEIAPYSDLKAVVPLREPITVPRADVAFGFNAVLPVESLRDVKNLSWALATQADGLPTLYVDFDADGILTDETAIVLEPKGPDVFVAEHNSRLPSPDGSAQQEFRTLWLVRVNGGEAVLHRYSTRERTGQILLGDDEYDFTLRTRYPTYDSRGAVVAIDTNRDGRVDFADHSLEVFRVEDRFAAVAGQKFRIEPNPDGSLLTLFPTGESGELLGSLTEGTTAPEIGAESPLSSAVNRVTILNFWSPRCSFCRRMADELSTARQELNGVQFVSITNADSDSVSEVGEVEAHSWPSVAGGEGEALFEAYRIAVVPTYFVLDKSGVIRARGSTLEWESILAAARSLSDPQVQGKPSSNQK